MEKKIEDYLHLYLGCEVEYGFEDRKAIGDLHGFQEPFGWQVFTRRIIPQYHYVRPDWDAIEEDFFNNCEKTGILYPNANALFEWFRSRPEFQLRQNQEGMAVGFMLWVVGNFIKKYDGFIHRMGSINADPKTPSELLKLYKQSPEYKHYGKSTS